ncbi:MAG: hypothetical protein M1837_001032 [Sclerophora amabilis]|nr:MAG: hypothetical protein M1837_001032 [Sclerophora amabilis]
MGLDVGLEECHAIVTGGTRGMGRSFVETFLRNGVNVSHCARKVAGDEFAEFTNSLRGSQKPRAVGTPLNVGSKQDVDTWLTRAASEFGRIDIVIANGG